MKPGDMIRMASGTLAMVERVLPNGRFLVTLPTVYVINGKPVNQAIVKPIIFYVVEEYKD